MTPARRTQFLSRAIAALAFLAAGAAGATPVYWTDWTGADTDPGPGFKGQGTIQTSTSTVTVTYTNAQGVGFYQSSGGTDFCGAFVGGIPPRRDERSLSTEDVQDYLATLLAETRRGQQAEEDGGAR